MRGASRVIAIVLLFCFAQPVSSQNILGKDQEEVFRIMVKQFDEFIARFNFEVSIDGSAIQDTAHVYWQLDKKEIKVSRKAAVGMLIDYGFAQEKPELSMQFVQHVTQTQPVLINFYDKDWYAQIHRKVRYKGKKYNMDITLNIEVHDNNGSKWVLCGLEAPFLLPPKTKHDKDRLIQPDSNETQFLYLITALSDNNHFGEYLPKDFEPDLLTRLYYEVVVNQSITYLHTNELPVYHFLQIPGWAIQISYVNRVEGNRGWLITDIKKLTDADKKLYRKELLNIP